MFEAIESPYLVPSGGKVKINKFSTTPPGEVSKSDLKKELRVINEEIAKLQRVLYGHHKYSILMVFQGMDASGKDGAIREVLHGVNPAGCQIFSFQAPSAEELDHDFLWRTTKCLPERGRIGVFNRSYYEEVLIVRVHPEFLGPQNLPETINLNNIWGERLKSIRDHEKHLARNGVIVLKFWLNISKDEQKKRILKRLDNPSKNWKLDEADVLERDYWNDYMKAYQAALAETSMPWAPWYAVPADNKPYARKVIADILLKTLNTLDLHYRESEGLAKVKLDKLRQLLDSH